jgi:TolB-like protein/Flp pilus assembly protein TadD
MSTAVTDSRPRRRLESWKEIAGYLQRDVSTVQRWERKEALPVHRHLHDKIGSVYAFTDELEAWQDRRRPGSEDNSADVRVAAPRPPAPRIRTLAGAAFILSVAVGCYAWWTLTTSSPSVRSIAVLPLRNLTGDPSQEWLSDGITDALNGAFARIGSLSVVSNTSAQRFKNSQLSAQQIARQLGGVDALLEGSVTRAAARVRVSLALVHAHSDHRLWVGTYERDLRDVLELSREIAASAAAELRMAVTGDDRRRMEVRRTPDTTAFEAYLQGLHLRHRSHDGGCIEAERYFVQSITLDPAFGEPYAELALCYAFHDRHVSGDSRLFDRAMTAAKTAISLDERLGTPYAVLGLVAMRRDYDQSLAGTLFHRAVALEAGATAAQMALGEFLAVTGREDEGVAAVRQVLRLNPLSPDQNVGVGHLLLRLGRLEEAVAQLRNTTVLAPNFASAWYWLSEASAQRGDRDEAVDARLRWLELIAVPSQALRLRDELRTVYEERGWNEFWARELAYARQERERPGSVYRLELHRYSLPAHMARRAARLEQWDIALTELEQGVADRHHLLPFTVIDRLYTPMHTHPRFEALGRAMNLPIARQ